MSKSKKKKEISEFDRRASRGMDKFSGRVKKLTGKLTGNEQLELKGRLLISRAKFNKKTDIRNIIHNLKEKIAGKINDSL